MNAKCNVEGCKREAQRGGLCWGHLWRRTHGLPLDVELRERGRPPVEVFRDAVLSVAEVDGFDGEAFERAWARVRTAAWRWAHAKKTTGRYCNRSG